MAKVNIVVLDRDGVINEDSDAYIKSAEEWQAIPGSIDAIVKLCNCGFRVFVVTNQSGIGRGLFDTNTLQEMHDKMNHQVEEAGGKIERIFHCPHTPVDGCDCRKPATGMLDKLERYLDKSIDGAFFIGDSLSDMQLALIKNCQPLLVLTGKGSLTRNEADISANHIPMFSDLAAASNFILNDSGTTSCTVNS
ncbi:MAG: D-glycero-beta-D-manno-heptose 1,7-bisphosphate 7-phosphatase [Pseudomonadales bacterium]